MFDIGFQEIVLIGVVALVVLGPEKMPEAVRTVALLVGRLKRTFSALKTEIEKEVGADEIRRQLRNEEIMERFKTAQNQIQSTIDTVKDSAEEIRKASELESETASMSSYGGGPIESPAAITNEPPTSESVASTVASESAPVETTHGSTENETNKSTT